MTAIICPQCGLGDDLGLSGYDGGYDWENNCCASCSAGEAPAYECCDFCDREYAEVGEDEHGEDMHDVVQGALHLSACTECATRPHADLIADWGPWC